MDYIKRKLIDTLLIQFRGVPSTFKLNIFDFMKVHKKWFGLSLMVALWSIALQTYDINQYARAITKNSIMQLVDLNNFKNLLYDSCLTYNDVPKRTLTSSDCYVCESLDQVNFISDPKTTLESYEDLDWPVTYKSDVSYQITKQNIISKLINDNILPCDYESNLKINPVRAIESKFGWFMQWRNCDDVKGKAMRSLYKPDLFINPSTETWTLMASNYLTFNYKKIDLYYDSRVAVTQISGTFKYKLVPKKPCTEMCKTLDGRLTAKHVLIFNSLFWAFQYRPVTNSTESIAFIHHLE